MRRISNLPKTLIVILIFAAIGLSFEKAGGAQRSEENQSGEIGGQTEPDSLKSEVAVDSTDKIIAFYFHTTKRCASCRKIEAYSKEAIATAFADELESGILEYRPVNTDEKENRHFIADFQLYTKSLILAEYTGGERERWKNLDKVWRLLKDKDAFQGYVRDEVRAFLEAQ